MRGVRLADAYSIYKRASSNDHFTDDYDDREQNLGTYPLHSFFFLKKKNSVCKRIYRTDLRF